MYPYVLEHWVGNTMLIPTYGLLLVCAYTAGYIESLRRAIRLGLDPKHIERLFLITVVVSLAGARLFHIAVEEWAYYRKNPADILAIWEGGFTFYGGLLLTLVAIRIYCGRKQLPFLQVLDLLTPPTLLALAIGRVGCFAAGCCWGKSTQLPWGVTFSHKQTLSGMRYVPVHPVQLYEAVGALLIFLWLNRTALSKTSHGNVTAWGLLTYAALRFGVEFFRGDDYRGYVLGGYLSVSQAISLFIAAILLTRYRGLFSGLPRVPRPRLAE